MIQELNPVLAALVESEALGSAVSEAVGIKRVPIEDRRFESGEFKLRPLASVRGRIVFVVQSLAGSPEVSVAERLVRLLFLLFGLKDAGAACTIAIIPYLAFARKDRRTQSRDPVTMRYVAQLVEASGVDRIIAVDVHNPAALDNAFRVPVDHLSAIPLLVDHIATQLPGSRITVASPDVGGVKRAQIFRELLERRLGLEVNFAFIEKRRTGGLVSSGRVVGEVENRDTLIVDDLCASGGTLIRAAKAMHEAGSRTVQVAFTHAPYPDGLVALAADSTLARIVFTDSVGSVLQRQGGMSEPRLQILPVAPVLAEAVSRTLSGRPLAPLLDSWPAIDPA